MGKRENTLQKEIKRGHSRAVKYRKYRNQRTRRSQRGGSKELLNDELAFVSCFYGDDKNEAYMIPPLPTENHNCYFFTNNPKLFEKAKKDKWIAILDDKNKPITTDHLISCMYGKEVKVTPHHYPVLQQYPFLVFIDSKLPKVDMSVVYKLITTHFKNNKYALILRKHRSVDTIWNELDLSMEQERYKKHEKRYRDYVTQQIKEGWKDNIKDHAMCGFLIRNMRHPKINEINELWYSHIQNVGIQDQISFYFVRQRYPDSIKTFTENPYETKNDIIFNNNTGNIPIPIFSVGGINIADMVKKMIAAQIKK